MVIPVLLATLTFGLLGLAVYGLRSRGVAEERLMRATEKTASAPAPKSDAFSNLEPPGSIWSQLASLVKPLSKAAESGQANQVYDNIRIRLTEAGFRSSSALPIYMGSRIALSAIFALIAIAVSWAVRGTPHILVIGLGAAAGYISPGLIVDQVRKRRQRNIQQGLPDAIDLMVVCVEAGLGLGATLRRVAHEFRDSNRIIAEEFESTVLETEAGRGLMDALRGLGDRTGTQELKVLVSLLVQTDRFGTPMVEALRAQGDSMRVERMRRAEEMAEKAPVKMTLPAGLIFLSVLMILLGPAVMMLMETLTRR